MEIVFITYKPVINHLICSVEHVENIGIHYYKTLRCWKKNFIENKRYEAKLISVGWFILKFNPF